MSGDRPGRQRKAGEGVFPAPRPSKLRLLKPRSECSTADLVTELPQDVKAMLRRVRRKRAAARGGDEPGAA